MVSSSLVEPRCLANSRISTPARKSVPSLPHALLVTSILGWASAFCTPILQLASHSGRIHLLSTLQRYHVVSSYNCFLLLPLLVLIRHVNHSNVCIYIYIYIYIYICNRFVGARRNHYHTIIRATFVCLFPISSEVL